MRENLYVYIGLCLRHQREAAGYTQAEAGAALVPPHTRASIHQMERGSQRILLHTLLQLADLYGVQLLDLLPELRATRKLPP